MRQKRFLCSQAAAQMNKSNIVSNSLSTMSKKWRVKQVKRSNFKQALEEIKSHIFNSDFMAVSLQKTGSFSTPWQRVLPFDTPQTAYFKARRAADRFQILHFSLCPFTISASNTLTAYPYNFHLFPRDELKKGMPSYSFACQTSSLTSMGRLGFDFNACIYDGISYLSKAQESAVKHLTGNTLLQARSVQSTPASSVADSVFTERIKSRVRTWRNACKDSAGRTEDPLIQTLRKVVLGESHGSRPAMDIDVCSDRQVQLVLEVMKEYPDDIVPLLIPTKCGGTQGIRIVLTSSKEDKILFEKELQDLEEERSKQFRGFREVIDLISASQKPIVTHNSLDDFTFIHSKFLSPLPPTLDEFKVSLRSAFPHIIDLGHLMKEISPLRSKKSLPAASSFLKNRFFAPVDIYIPLQGAPDEMSESKAYGQNVVRVSHIFAKLSSVLKHSHQKSNSGNNFSLEEYANIFNPSCGDLPLESPDEDVKISSSNMRRLSIDNIVFLWGFTYGSPPGELKRLLSRYLKGFSEEFDVKFVDRSCAVVAFWKPGFAGAFIDAMNSEGTEDEGLSELISEGFRAADFETYKRVCETGIWNSDLADSLDQALRSTDELITDSRGRSPYEIWWDDDTVINLDEL